MRNVFKGVVVGVIATVMLSGTAVLAGSGVNGVFNLGVTNTVNALTRLTGATAGAFQLFVVNTSTIANSGAIRGDAHANYPAIFGVNYSNGAAVQGNATRGPGLRAFSSSSGAAADVTNGSSGPGLKITTNAAAPPLVVNSQIKVTNLNADFIDGIDSSSFIQGDRAGAFWDKSTGRTFLNRIDTIKGDPEVQILEVPQLLHINASCGSFGADTQWSTDIISDVDGLQVFYEGLGYPASYTTLNATDGLVLSAHAVGRLTIQAGIGANARTGQTLVTIDMFGTPSGGTCFQQFSALSQTQ